MRNQSVSLAAVLLNAGFLLPIGDYAGAGCYDLQVELLSILDNNQCKRAEDCVGVQLPEPFGCNQVLNKRNLPTLDRTYDLYNRSCGPFIYNCLYQIDRISCVKHRCIPRVDTLDMAKPSNSTVDHNGQPLRMR